jgi:hypothetical protein
MQRGPVVMQAGDPERMKLGTIQLREAGLGETNEQYRS